ncbi:MAG: flagellar biosynthesis protein FlhA [Sphingomonadaceae bacterium]|uniref:flagellar biosynthesis protein FlhA n=1 Tax=Thermaurantiacus sp. TaxID=2820283 RepID=UPI00298F14FB|nr:flagellar biosynthesis protein FlhA [Thermaurantiacus sp.]MCS6986828.1 flagellar biosynthesis protein FlhA [Sphingomonadaceae bacterium]MDW8413909.1 flagellar biosynthesis protein FlhA [Thermaurantiacus sp.]
MAVASPARWRAWLAGGAPALLPAAILAVMVLMVVPIPAPLLDLFFVGNILLALVMLMVVLHVGRPLDFSAFPTVLLFATLFRLALNVASTRVVLLEGHTGTDAAGRVIEAFGKVLIGGNFVVGLIVFAILMIINLMVIARGAGRVSEVSARFTLDALPGKQMAIDADLNAGMLTPAEAQARRQEVATEADFYGAMDGASKFVKGDAAAGILILLINIVGGLVIGTWMHGLSAREAAGLYLVLSVGDALVAQIPALLLSIAAATLVTRTSEDRRLDLQVRTQFGHAAAWWPAAVILGLMALLPAMPGAVLAPAAVVAGVVAWRLRTPARREPDPLLTAPAESPRIEWSEVGEAAAVTLEIGYGLIPLVDEAAGAPLMARITGVRRQLSRELGFVLPMVRVRDEMALAPQAYRITIAGERVGQGEAWPQDLLALEAEAIADPVPGRETKDPAFGLPARWIDPTLEARAVAAGYTVVDPSTVIATHLHKLLKAHAALLFGLDEAQALIDRLADAAPQLAQQLGPKHVPLPTVAAVLRALLEEGVPLRDFRRIGAAIVQAAARTQDPAELVEAVRAEVGGIVVNAIAEPERPLKLIALAPELEALLLQAVRAAPGAPFPFEPALGNRVVEAVRDAAAPALATGDPVAVVTQPAPRRALWRLLRSAGLGLPVLGFTEIPDARAIEVLAVVGGEATSATLATEAVR